MKLDRVLRAIRDFLTVVGIYKFLINALTTFKLRRLPKNPAVTFIVYQSAVWKCDSVYWHLANDQKIDASITVLPVLNRGLADDDELRRTREYFKSKGFKVNDFVLGDGFLKQRMFFKQFDTVVFSDCWNLSQSITYYYLLFFWDCVYVPYSHQVSSYAGFQTQYNQPFHNLVRAIYAPQKDEYNIFRDNSHIGNSNVQYLGYAGVDRLIEASDQSCSPVTTVFPYDPWRVFKNQSARRLIWSPHHSFNWTERKYSNFVEMHQIMLDLAKKYEGYINIVFKPHPMLKENLRNSLWGVERTDAYYRKWQEQENCVLMEGEYQSLFFYSDGLLHDCGSFVAEYSYLKKVHAFVYSSKDIKSCFNSFGNKCLDRAHAIFNDDDLREFFEMLLVEKEEFPASDDDFLETLRHQSRGSGQRIGADIICQGIRYND